MADGGLKLELDEALSDRLKAAAAALGRSVDDYAAELIADGLDQDWAESYARFEDYERTGEFLDAGPALADFRRKVADRARAKSR